VCYEEIVFSGYTVKEEVVTFNSEEFKVSNNYMSITFDRDNVLAMLSKGEPFKARIVGISIPIVKVKRRIIHGNKI